AYGADDVCGDMSFMERLEGVTEGLMKEGMDAIALDRDCREGICGSCAMMINGMPHGPERGTTVCQLHMRKFRDGEHIYIEPWRARAFPVVRDLVTDRSSFDRIIQAGGGVPGQSGGGAPRDTQPRPHRRREHSPGAAP